MAGAYGGGCVSESSLPGLVGDLRGALGDDPKGARFIRTVPRYGYAFLRGDGARRRPSGRSPVERRLAGHAVPLPNGEHLIGRGEDCPIRSDSTRVSRHHARVRVTSERLLVEDLGSRNGTWVHGRRIDGAAQLTEGDTIRVGSEVIQFVAVSADEPTIAD